MSAPHKLAHLDLSTRRRAAVLAGHTGDRETARDLLADLDGAVRAAALGALTRLGCLTAADLEAAFTDPDPGVRRRATEVFATVADQDRFAALSPLPLLEDGDATVVESAAWACGELPPDRPTALAAVGPLAQLATGAEDALVREAAVAALGSLGHPDGLPAILAATRDKATVRRRAVLALAPHEGPEVEAALTRATTDRDWQVRQAAEDLGAVAPDQDPDER